MEAAPQVQSCPSPQTQAMDWSGNVVARSSFHTICIFVYILHLMCPEVAVYHGMASLPALLLA